MNGNGNDNKEMTGRERERGKRVPSKFCVLCAAVGVLFRFLPPVLVCSEETDGIGNPRVEIVEKRTEKLPKMRTLGVFPGVSQ